jgi:signal transduction histidine kinase
VYLAAALTVLGLGASIVYASRVSAQVDAAALSIATDASPAIEHLSAARGHLLQVKLAAATALEDHPPGAKVDPRQFQLALARLHQELETYRSFPFYPYEDEHFRRVAETLYELDGRVSRFVALLNSHDLVEAQSFERTKLAVTALRLDQQLQELVTFNADQQHRMGLEIPRIRTRGARIEFMMGGGTTILAVLMLALVIRAERRYTQLLAVQRDETEIHSRRASEFSSRLRELLGSTTRIAQAITARHEAHRVLQLLVDESRSLLGAQYAALGVGLDPERPFDPWVHSGLSRETAEAMGTAPRPVGVLGTVARGSATLRLDALAEHPAFHGFPERHPRIGPFLGVPILHGGSNVGNLFIARAEGEAGFSEADEEISKLLAAQAGVAQTNARLYDDAVTATRAREDLLATVSHDLKNPLSNVKISAQMLSRISSDPKVNELATRIERSAERMTRLISELLDAARLEAGVLRPETRPEPVRGLVEAALQGIQPIASERAIQIYTESPPSLAVLCDRYLVLRVFSNLLGNAVKFCPPAGRIDLGYQVSGGQIVISVKDTGPGIPRDQLPHVFERFWQEKNDRRGTGLGLSIVKGIVEAHGGRSWVESIPGHGTEVLFTLPIAEAGEASAAAPPLDAGPQDLGSQVPRP